MARDEFGEKTRRDLSDRVQGFCSNPECGSQTKGPHTDDDKVDNIGMACHIHAASPGGARYNPAQSAEERKAPSNGIWMCRKCGTLIDNDEARYPADLLRAWKREAEVRARIRLEQCSSDSLLQCGAEATDELLRWPTTLPDGTWMERPELERLLTMVREDDLRPIVLLGVPGSGKSALLARFGTALRGEGMHVVAIKADRLPATIRNARDLRDYLGLPVPVASAVYAISRVARTVLVIDQLDALSDLLDVNTDRLSVLLNLIKDVVGNDSVRVVCSARVFDYRHDVRFEQLAARELKLELPAMETVDQALSTARHNPKRTPDALRELLRTPQWLKAFLGLGLSDNEDLPTTWHALLERVWARKIVSEPDTAAVCENAVRWLATEMSRREELWVPRSELGQSAVAVARLVSQGVLALDERGHRVGFAHQLFYEFARARTFLGDESLVEYVRKSQGSLFVRPTLWTALGYMRTADPSRYSNDLACLWTCELRRHVRLLLVEFMGQQQEPEDHEAVILLPLLTDPTWQRAAFNAVAGSRGWYARLQRGYLKGPMTGETPDLVVGVLSAGMRIDAGLTLALLKECWMSDRRFALCTLAVLRNLDTWNQSAFELANDAVASTDGESLNGVVWQLARTQPAYAIRLVASSLERELTRVLLEVAPSVPLPSDASEEERMAWYVNREPRHSLDNLLSSVSGRHSNLHELAKSEPGVFLDMLLPWMARLLEHATESDSGGCCYLDDHLLGSKPVDGPPRELADALRTAVQQLAVSSAARFWSIVKQWRSSELMSVHVALSFGLELAAKGDPDSVLEYLLEDPRRLCIGESHYAHYTRALLIALGPYVDADQVALLEHAISCSEPHGRLQGHSARSRWHAQRFDREHRLDLLRALPPSLLSAEARSIIDQETRVFGTGDRKLSRSHGFRAVVSPMTAAQMAKARDDDIIHLFDELEDSTGFDHPRRWMDGGSVQASREVAGLAKAEPARAAGLIQRFRPGQQENPVGEILRALAETELATHELEELVVACDRRGFSSEEFRTDTAWALEKRAGSGLSDDILELLISWISEEPRGPIREDKEDRGRPPFLWGLGGGGFSPRGSYPMLSTVTVALLSRKPPDLEKSVQVLSSHLTRGDSSDVWRPISWHLGWLGLAEPIGAAALIDSLFHRYPAVLQSGDGIRLLAETSWWLPRDQTRRHALQVRDGDWAHGRRAFGELLGFLGVRDPEVEWARLELEQLLATKSDGEIRLGVTGACMHLWTSSWRARCTNALERLIREGGHAEREEVLDSLHPSELIVDQDSRRVMLALSSDPEAFLARPGLSLEWVSGLMHSYTVDVLSLCEGIVQALESRAHGAEAPLVQIGSETLVRLAVTLQRLPAFRVAGLALFERLLAMGFYGARRALDEVDLWARRRV